MKLIDKSLILPPNISYGASRSGLTTRNPHKRNTRTTKEPQALFGKNRTVLSGDSFCCENSLPSDLERKEKGDLDGGKEWNHYIQTGPQPVLQLKPCQ